jgi:hypothetical protein
LWREARKRRIVINEEEQNKDKMNDYRRELPASIALPVADMLGVNNSY